MKDPLAEQRKACLTIPLSFDQFQLGHLSLDHPVIDPPGETSSHGIFVFLNPSSKRLEIGKLTALHLHKPAIKALSATGAQHAGKQQHQVLGPIDFWANLAETVK